MKVFKIVVAGLLGLALFSGCSEKADTPESAITNYYDAGKSGDVEKFKKFSTQRTQHLFAKYVCGGNLTKSCLKERFEALESFRIIETIGRATETPSVWLEEKLKDGSSRKFLLKMNKSENSYKVDMW